jgi:hypothetical protein
MILLAVALLLAHAAFAQQGRYSLNEELFYRINFGRADDVKLLLGRGANPNAISSTGEYALTVAIGRDDDEAVLIVRALLDKGADPNIYDKMNPYPIVSAVVNNKAQIVADLLAKGADFHVRSQNGRTLIEIAQANNNEDIRKMLQDQIDKEAAATAALRTPEKFKEAIHRYVYGSCNYQYWNFVLDSRQDPDKDQDTKTRIARARLDLSMLIEQIQKYYPNTPSADLQRISTDAAQQIYGTLNDMVSNQNRIKQGVGTDADANTRCHKISDAVQIDFPPSAIK